MKGNWKGEASFTKGFQWHLQNWAENGREVITVQITVDKALLQNLGMYCSGPHLPFRT